MKKKVLLPMASIAILGTIAGASSLSLVKAEDASWSDETKTSFVDFFLGAVDMESDFTLSYYGDGVLFHSSDQISSTRRHLYLTANYDGTSQFIGETSIYAGSDGYAYSESLSIGNEVASSALTDDDDAQIVYADYYSSWFKLPSTYSVSSFSKYFSVASSDTGYTVTLTSLGEGILLPRLISYLPQLDSYNYDTSSYKEQIGDFEILCDASGLPTSMSFNLIYSDRYGGTYQHYDTTLTSIEEVTGITPITPTSSEEDRAELDTLLSELSEKILTGNFTQTTEYLIEEGGVLYETVDPITYNCYYELDSNPATGGSHYPLMLSDFPLEADSYGLTLVGLYYFADDGYYCQTGISPEEDFIEPINSYTYSDIASIVPAVYSISSDFYTKKTVTGTTGTSTTGFVFDMASVDFDSYYFSYSLLEQVLGIGDYIGTYGGYFMSGSYAFDLQHLTIYKEGDTYVTELSAASQALSDSDQYLVARSVFHSFGSTDMEAVDDVNIQNCLEVVKAYESMI